MQAVCMLPVYSRPVDLAQSVVKKQLARCIYLPDAFHLVFCVCAMFPALNRPSYDQQHLASGLATTIYTCGYDESRAS